jgi:hypothetical protein
MHRGKFVKIYVGPKKKKWVVHLDVICERSEFFRKAFTGGFIEANNKEIYLHEDDPKAFGLFIDWIYCKNLYCQMHHEDPADITFKHIKDWLSLYIFADKIALQELSEQALEQYKQCSEGTLPCVSEIQLIYENTPEQSSLREHIVNALVEEFFNQGPDDFEYLADAISCHTEFARDVAKAQKEHILLRNAKSCQLENCSVHTNTKARRTTRGQFKKANQCIQRY